MTDIIRFQFRQLFRTRIVHLANIMMLGIIFILLFVSSDTSDEIRETMTAYLPQTISFAAAIALMAPLIMIGIVCGDDFQDKTINHELTAGRSRAASFFGRAIPVMIAAPLTAAALISIPYVIYGALFGVGDTIPLSNIILRILLMLFPLLRLSAFFVFLIFVTKKQLAAVIGALGTTLLTIGLISGSTAILAYTTPSSNTGNSLMISSPSLKSGSSYTLRAGCSLSGGSSFYSLQTGCTIGSGTQSVDVTASTSISGSMGGGGFPGGGGGRW